MRTLCEWNYLLYVLTDAKVSENPANRINPVEDIVSHATQKPPSAVNPSLVTRVLSGCRHFSADLVWCQKHALSVDDFLLQHHHTGVEESNPRATDCHDGQLRHLQTESQPSSLSSEDDGGRTSRQQQLPQQLMNRLCSSSPHFYSTCGCVFQPVKLLQRRKDSDVSPLPPPTALSCSESDAIPLKVIGGFRGLQFLHLRPAAETGNAAGDRSSKLLSCLYPLHPGDLSSRPRTQLEIVDLGSTYKVRLCSASDNQLSGPPVSGSSLQPDSGGSNRKPNVDLAEPVRARLDDGRAVDVLNPVSLFGIRQRSALGNKTRSPRKSRESVTGSKLSPWTSTPLLCPEADSGVLGQPAGCVTELANIAPDGNKVSNADRDLDLSVSADIAERTGPAVCLGLPENSGLTTNRELLGAARFPEYAGLHWDTALPLGRPGNTGVTVSSVDLIAESGNVVSARLAEDKGLLGDATSLRDGSMHHSGIDSSNEPPNECLPATPAALATSAVNLKCATPDLQRHRITCPNPQLLQDLHGRTGSANDCSEGTSDANKSHSAWHVVPTSKESPHSNP